MQERIKEMRERAGLTQAQLAQRLGFESQSLISMWETGERTPRSEKLPELAQILGCTIGDLFGEPGGR